MGNTMKNREQKHITKFIRSVCKGKDEEEIRQAELNYLRFINLAERINKRLIVEKNINNESSAV